MQEETQQLAEENAAKGLRRRSTMQEENADSHALVRIPSSRQVRHQPHRVGCGIARLGLAVGETLMLLTSHSHPCWNTY